MGMNELPAWGYNNRVWGGFQAKMESVQSLEVKNYKDWKKTTTGTAVLQTDGSQPPHPGRKRGYEEEWGFFAGVLGG